MKVVSIIGGLGSQMFKYAFYLALRELCKDQVLIDSTCYLQSSYPYLLNEVFGIDAPDIKSLLSDEEIKAISEKHSNYIDICLRTMTARGKTDYYILGTKHTYTSPPFPLWRVFQQKALYVLHRFGIHFSFSIEDVIGGDNSYFNEYYHMSDVHFASFKKEVMDAFSFPEFNDEKNRYYSNMINNLNSVAVHVRRTDYSKVSSKIVNGGFYNRAINYVKQKNQNEKLTFFVFSDDFDWCRQNMEAIGLERDDEVVYVDWNKGKSSYIDMQLMTYCKHNIISNSSFSWWGAYLSGREDKIVCAPKGFWDNIENHF